MDNSASILNDIKKLLGINEEDTSFDTDVIIHINTIFMSLRQMGIGPENGFSIADSSSIWTDFSEDSVLLNSVKTYIYLRVKLVFDPPLSTSTIECYNKLVSEIEWRMHSRVTYANN